MRFLIIGGSGFIGSHVLAHVRSLGYEAIGTQSRPRLEGLLKFNLLDDRIVECAGRSFFEREGQVYVIHCAVISNMDQCLIDRESSHCVNVERTIQLIEDIRSFKTKHVFLSSCFVFDGTIGYYHEDHPLTPVNEYARHKVEVEQYLQKNEPDALIARLEKIVGDDPQERQLFAFWFKHLCNGDPLVCWEGSLLSPTYVKDVAHGIVLACEKNLKGVYHISNSEFFYRDELARQFCYALGEVPNVISKPLEEFNFPDKRALKSYLDGSKFIKATGIRFTSMRDVFQAFQQNIKRK
ncbi:MAG: SDR family oxidoreductase [Limisphaerales bacterium]